MSIAEGVALVAIMIALRTTRNVLDGRELRKWKRACRFMKLHEFNHREIMVCLLDYRMAAMLLEGKLAEAIDRGDDQARHELGQRVESFLKALDVFDVELQNVMVSDKKLSRRLGSVDHAIVKEQYAEWRELFGKLRSLANYLAAYRLTRVAVDTAE